MIPCEISSVIVDHVQTERLTIRRFEASDLHFVADLYSRWEVSRFIGVTPKVLSHTEAERRLQKFIDPPLAPEQGYWLACARDTLAPLGTLMLVPIPQESYSGPPLPVPDLEIGWHFHPDSWGKGYASEGAAAVLHMGIDSPHRVVALVYQDNLPSHRVAKRLGMTALGVTDHFFGTICNAYAKSTNGE